MKTDGIGELHFNRVSRPQGSRVFCFRGTRIENVDRSKDLMASLNDAEIDELRQQIREKILKNGSLSPAVRFQANNLFFWRYQHLFQELKSLKEWILKLKISILRIDAPDVGPLGQTFFRGEEGKRILWRPEYEYPYFVKQLCAELGVKAVFRKMSLKDRFVQGIVRQRGWLFFFIKLFALFVRTLKPSPLLKRAKILSDRCDTLFVARSRSQMEFFINLIQHPKLVGQNCNLKVMFDPTLYDRNALQFFATKYHSPPWLLASSSAYRMRDLFVAAAKTIVAAWRVKAEPLSVQVGDTKAVDPFVETCRELILYSLDQVIHETALARTVRSCKAKTLISMESISPYIFIHDSVAHEFGCRSLRFQTASTTENETVDLAAANGYFVDSEDLRARLVSVFQKASTRIRFIGNPLIRNSSGQQRLGSASGRVRILYFSQPHEPSTQNAILLELADWQKASAAHRDILIKVHPRDDFDFRPFSRFNLLPRDCSVAESLVDIDLAVSRCSGTLGDALLLGVPYVACRFSAFDRSASTTYMAEDLGVNVLDRSELRVVLDSLRDYSGSFFQKRQIFCVNQFKEFSFDWL